MVQKTALVHRTPEAERCFLAWASTPFQIVHAPAAIQIASSAMRGSFQRQSTISAPAQKSTPLSGSTTRARSRMPRASSRCRPRAGRRSCRALRNENTLKALRRAGVFSGMTDDPAVWERLRGMGMDPIVTGDLAGLVRALW